MPISSGVRLGLIVLLMALAHTAAAQQNRPFTPEELRSFVEAYKQDPRGPYQAIRWFCPDGSVIGAQERCKEPGGIQHALHKDQVVQVQRRNGLYLGQILAGTPTADFLDAPHHYSRAKQYQVERFLQAADDGWILRKARYYRGAIQAEDEEAWGKTFLTTILADQPLAATQFFFLRQLTRDLPHEAVDNLVQKIRADAKTIADTYSPFSDLRVKIHGQPEATDLDAVKAFRTAHRTRVPPAVAQILAALEADLERLYMVPASERLARPVRRLPASLSLKPQAEAFVAEVDRMSPAERARGGADLLWTVRESFGRARFGNTRLALLDVSVALEDLVFQASAAWEPADTRGLMEKAYVLAKAAAGSGWIEAWEWITVEPLLRPPAAGTSPTLVSFRAQVEQTRRVVEWGVGLTNATYGATVERFAAFEPMAHGFVDDRLRASVLLPLGEVAGTLAAVVARHAGQRNAVMDLPDPSQIRGLNPGFALGTLRIIDGSAEHLAFAPEAIYVMLRPPSEMKPVAGIATVSEGNVVSHVQLLARNLGIPNAVLTPEALRALKAHEGQQVFYAVSPGGTVRLKAARQMTAEERELVETRQRSEERIRVPTNRLALNHKTLTPLYDLRASDSGRLCGPKAANLGQLSSMFPGRVAPGFIIPFGIFRDHMNQAMPGTAGTYWDFLRQTFTEATAAQRQGVPEAEVDAAVLARLATLREGIEKMPLQPTFVEALRKQFAAVFGTPVGQTPVFIRSDTNMEDLKDFTGAGLNLTVPNVVSEEDLLQGVRRVWASPYRERGYRWRQKFLRNPEDVYPSILVLKSVNVDKSGVMITSGLASGDSRDVTVAFNRGVGGAVDGQAAETYLLAHTGDDRLLAPAREVGYRVLLPTGGVADRVATFEQPILTEVERQQLRTLSLDVRQRLPRMPGVESSGPFDVELGFLDGYLWLFQVRPFVENRNARSTNYLLAMDPPIPAGKQVSLQEAVNAGSHP